MCLDYWFNHTFLSLAWSIGTHNWKPDIIGDNRIAMPYTLIHNFVMLYILSSAIIRSKC